MTTKTALVTSRGHLREETVLVLRWLLSATEQNDRQVVCAWTRCIAIVALAVISRRTMLALAPLSATLAYIYCPNLRADCVDSGQSTPSLVTGIVGLSCRNIDTKSQQIARSLVGCLELPWSRVESSWRNQQSSCSGLSWWRPLTQLPQQQPPTKVSIVLLDYRVLQRKGCDCVPSKLTLIARF